MGQGAPETDADSGYRAVAIPLERKLRPDEADLLAQLSAEFPRADFYFSYQKPGNLILHLHAVDLKALKRALRVGGNGGPKRAEQDSGLGARIVKAIEAVRSYGIQGRKRVYVGYDAERKVRNRKGKEEARGKHFYALDAHFRPDNNGFPEDRVNTIACGDAQDVLRTLPDNCVDLVLTSPSYNFGLEYGTAEDGVGWSRYFDKLFAVFDECIRVLKFAGRIVVNIQPLYSDYIPSHHIVSEFFLRRKLIWKAEILWEKHNYNCKYTAWGSWKSPSNPYFKYTWEFLEVFAKGTMRKPGRTENADITADEFKKWVVAKWAIAPERDMEKFGHPAMFPEELALRVIKLFSFREDLVLDPFNGAGTTTAVARRMGRRFFGIDISEKYCRTARRRAGSTLL